MEDAVVVRGNNNRRKDITGCLLYSGEHFAQTLEGSSEVLEALVPRIAADKRHFEVVNVVDHETQLRQYPNGSMGCLYSLDLRDRIESLAPRRIDVGDQSVRTDHRDEVRW